MNQKRIEMACRGLSYSDGGLDDIHIMFILGLKQNDISRIELENLLYLKNTVSELPPLKIKTT